MDAEIRLLPSLDGKRFVSVGKSTSALSKEEFSNLLSVVYAWGSENNIEWSDKP